MSGCRTVTEEEIRQYQKAGWVKLPGFVQPAMVELLLGIGRRRMGESGDDNELDSSSFRYFNPERGEGLSNPSIAPLIRATGCNAKALMRRRVGVEVRYYTDSYAVKLPAARTTKHAGNGHTSFHQDFSTWALDRSGGMTFWIALVDLGPEMGTMSFVNGSHRAGVLGAYQSCRDTDLVLQYPELMEHCTISEPLCYRAGDATVHSNLTVHGAGENKTSRPRWAYIVIVNPSDARWNGAPAEAFDCAGLRLHEELDDARFPIVS